MSKRGMSSDQCPLLLRTLIIGDDAELLAKVSSVLGKKDYYLPMLDGPRMQRIDAEDEVTRRNNAAARVAPTAIIFAGLGDSACNALQTHFPAKRCHRIYNVDQLRDSLEGIPTRSRELLTWGRNRIGIGLLRALREKREICFSSEDSPSDSPSIAYEHLVACEEGNELAQVIAANYAFSIGADLCLIPTVPQADTDRILESFYGLYEQKEAAPTAILEQLRDELRIRANVVCKRRYRSLTFISKELPWGFAFPNVPSTHIFIYPDLGISLINAIAAEQPGTTGIRVAAVIDPMEVEAPEVEWTAKNLANRSALVRGYRHRGATVSQVSRMLELLPYDFLLIATHCGDAGGWRFTYEFRDSEEIDRKLVVDIAIGVSIVPGKEKLEVMQFTKFVSLDGVSWDDPIEKAKLYVGTALKDYLARDSNGKGLEPAKRESIARVPGSSALKMFDGNMIVAPKTLADNGAPIILNNACASWHRLAATFTFGNARAYIGTLFSVSNGEAQDVVTQLLGKHFGKPLSVALWHAQNAVYQGSIRRPYVLVGPHFQKIRGTAQQDVPAYLRARLLRSKKHWTERANSADLEGESTQETVNDYLRFLNFELDGLSAHYLEQRTN